MATHFPALEDFEETPVGQPGATPIDLGLGDDTGFLDREKEILGAEASRFATVDDNNLLGGGEVDPDSQFRSNFPEMNMFDSNVCEFSPGKGYRKWLGGLITDFLIGNWAWGRYHWNV